MRFVHDVESDLRYGGIFRCKLRKKRGILLVCWPLRVLGNDFAVVTSVIMTCYGISCSVQAKEAMEITYMSMIHILAPLDRHPWTSLSYAAKFVGSSGPPS